jgi:hypothetical protein
VTTLTAAQGSASGTSKSLTVSPGANHQIAASTSTPQTAGTAFNVSLSAQDRWDNPTGNLSGSKAMAFSGPKAAPNGNSPSYPANVTFTAGAGTASVTLYDAQTTTITAKDSTDNLVGVASGSLTVNSASPQSFSVPTPTTRTAGTAFNEKLTAFDAYGNTATTYTGSQAVSFSDPASSPNGTAPTYPASVSFASGVGTASITLVDAQTTPLTATQGTLTGTSGSFVVQARTASQLTFLTQPGGASAGAAFSSQPVLTAFDSFGNTVTSYAKSVSLSIKSGTGTAGSILSGCTSSLSTGVTTFSGCQINNSGSSFQLSASDGSLTSTGNAFDVRGGTTVTESSPGTYSLTVPAGVTGFNFTMNGGGGGGGGAGASGAAGGTVSGTIVIPSSASSTTFTVIVGGGGASGAPASGGAGGSSGTGCALGGNGGAGATDGGGGGGGATCINLFGAPAVTIVSVGGGGGGGGGASTGSGGAGGGGPTSNPGSNTAASGTTAGSETGGKGAKTATTGVFPFLITNTAGAAGTGTGGANGSAGGTCSGGSCTTGGAGGGGSSNGGGGGGGGWASGGGGGGGLNASNAGGGGGGGSAYTGGTQSGSSNYAVTVSAASNGGGSAGGSANTSGIPGAVNFTGVGLTLA